MKNQFVHSTERLVQFACVVIFLGLLSEASVIAENLENSTEKASITVRNEGGWARVESPNFRCWCQLPEDRALQLVECCEAWRDRLRITWISNPGSEGWTPKCELVVHPNRGQYNCALNRSGDLSVGSTRMKFDQGRTILRRIDVRADARDWSNAALPHELTHVVLGERFGGRNLPRWADEGIAMLSESREKHQERLASLRQFTAKESLPTISDLVQTQCVQEPDKRNAFYGQSLGLTLLLIGKSTPAHFAGFMEDSCEIGIDPALRKHYQLQGINALQREWNDWINNPCNLTTAADFRHNLVTPFKNGGNHVF